ncbi:MAG: VCBS repeat-containing protein, partial [Betaproteobacteria bacterium]|nr:VCBS repeat-containing protein [Betaproteobacteria bacterium]
MAGNGQTPSEIISVPKGGGALHGIGEKFSPDLFTGSGNFSVPINLPPGRNGFQPQLSLVYSTGNGNGAFGMGWALSVPSVSRKTSRGIPRYEDSDIFVLSGSEDLVPTKVLGGSQYYQPRTEGLFAKIRHVTGGGTDYWEAATKDGLVSTYGDPSGAAADKSTIYDPADPLKLFAWKLSETRDPFGNRIAYEYRRDKAQIGARNWNQNYLKRIRYADFDHAGATEFLVSVEFYYDDETLPHAVNPPVKQRTDRDQFSEYRSSFEIRTCRRCSLILVRTHPVAAAEIRDRAYRLIYLDERTDLAVADQVLPANGASLLSRIEVIGYDDTGSPSSELPPLDFAYTKFEPVKRKFEQLPAGAESVPPLSDPDVELVDLHGGGLPDLVQISGSVRYWRNLGDGVFGSRLTMRESPVNAKLSDPGVQLLDVNGDGRADLLVRDRGVAATFTLEFGPKWKRRPSADRIAPSFDFKDPEVRLLDLDGDGITDALRTAGQFECFFQDAQKGWRQVRTVARRSFDEFPDVSFSDPRARIADMSGDGLQDIFGYDPARILLGDIDGDGAADLVYVEDEKVTLWINQSGNGWSAQPVEIYGTPPVADGDVIRIIDLRGCGVAGILWSAGANNAVRQRMRYLDLAGNIKPYLLDQMSNNLGATTKVKYVSSTKFFLEDNKCHTTRWRTPLPFPVQVVSRVEVIDHLSGGKLTTEYRYHNGYWDGAEREFRGFGIVEQYDSDGFSDYGSTGLHGSGSTFQQVPTQYFSPPTLTRTWFHQGPVGDEYGAWEEQDYSDTYWQGDPSMLGHKSGVDGFLGGYCTAVYPHARRDMRDALRALRGSMLRSELYALDGSDREERPYTVTESAYGLREESPPTAAEPARRRLFFPHLIARRTTQWERGNDPMTQFAVTGDYDSFGQSCRQVSIACPRGWESMSDQPSKPYLATLSVTTYAQPSAGGPYIQDRVARTRGYEILSSANKTVTDISATTASSASLRLISESLNFYDGDPAIADHGAFSGLAFGQVRQFGAPVRTETLVLTQDILSTAYGANTPPYLDSQTPFTASADYPQAFVNALPTLAGYLFKPGGVSSEYSRGYFAIVTWKRYDFHTATGAGRGLLLAQKDQLGNEVGIDYDTPYKLLPVSVTDSQAMTITAEYDYRVLQPKRVADPNRNVTDITFTPAGLVEKVWVKGKLANNEGDRDPTRPGTRLEYGLRAFYDSVLVDPSNPQPAYVKAVKRVFYDTDPDATDETIETREYSDGFGRLLQTRTQGETLRFGHAHFGGGDAVLAADQSSGAGSLVTGTENTTSTDPNVTVSGWQRYDNKGRVVEKFEPFFDTGWDYDPPAAAQYGQKISMFYDPRGQAIRTVNPDGSEQRVIYGVPKDLADPPLSTLDTAKFDATPWEAYTYDPNDDAGRTHAAISVNYR